MARELRLYPNGLPHPPADVRRRIALELLIVSFLALIYLTLFPSPYRHIGMDIGLALTGLGLVLLTTSYTRERIWGSPHAPAFVRLRRCVLTILTTTIPPLVIFFLYGAVDAYLKEHRFTDVLYRLFRLNFFIVLLLYIPWALLQQTLFQFHLLGRLRALLPFATPMMLSIFCGLLYGAVHLPDWPLALLTAAGGFVWSYSYHQDRFVWPIALSHALLGATFFYWACDHDILQRYIEWIR